MELLDIILQGEAPVVGSKVVVGTKNVPTTELTPYFSSYYVEGSKSSKNIYNKYNIILLYRKETLENTLLPTTDVLPYLAQVLTNMDVTENAGGSKVVSVPTTELEFATQILDYVLLYGHVPGDAWEGFNNQPLTQPDQSLQMAFGASQARQLTDYEVLVAAEYERNRGIRHTTLALMYSNNVNQYVWFEGQNGQWHCYKQPGA